MAASINSASFWVSAWLSRLLSQIQGAVSEAMRNPQKWGRALDIDQHGYSTETYTMVPLCADYLGPATVKPDGVSTGDFTRLPNFGSRP